MTAASEWPSAEALLAPALAFAAVLAATSAVLRAATRHGFLAHPNARSSHTVSTPQGGGIGFAAVLLAYLALFPTPYPPALAMALLGSAIAALGLADDALNLRRDLRLACHIAACAIAALWLFEPGPATALLVLALAWWLNLYNFMDGIDGLAASQAAAYPLGALLIGSLDASAEYAAVLAAAALAFLCFNRAPARIFMGDAGSGFLGLHTGVLALWLWHSGELPIAASLILLLAFWGDATYTLTVRIATGQPFAQAHRTHLYQILARRFGHGPTTALFWLHALCYLLPLAALAVAFPPWQPALLALAAAPLAAACPLLKAGIDAG